MDRLKEVLIAELDKYVGEGADSLVFPIYDQKRQHYALAIMDYPVRNLPTEIIMVAWIGDNKFVIEEDMTDKKLIDALLQQGVPREQIVLAYDNEKVPFLPVPAVGLK